MCSTVGWAQTTYTPHVVQVSIRIITEELWDITSHKCFTILFSWSIDNFSCRISWTELIVMLSPRREQEIRYYILRKVSFVISQVCFQNLRISLRSAGNSLHIHICTGRIVNHTYEQDLLCTKMQLLSHQAGFWKYKHNTHCFMYKSVVTIWKFYLQVFFNP